MSAAAVADFARLFRFDELPVRTDRFIPLTRTEKDGTAVEVLCCLVDGVVLVHPDRWEQFVQVFKQLEERCKQAGVKSPLARPVKTG